MGERKSLGKKKIVYEGIFNLAEVFTLVQDFFKLKSYDMLDRLNEEIATEEGRQVIIKLFPFKKTSDYTKNVVKVIMLFKNMKDVVIEHDGIQKNMVTGRAQISVEGFIETDYEGSMSNQPLYFFIREVFDRFIYRVYTDKATSVLAEDVEHLRWQIKQYFNIQH